jgi:MFS family permease
MLFAPEEERFALSGAYRRYVLIVIWAVLIFRFVDLQIVSVLLEPIRKEFSISDTQLGLLSGLAFSLFYGGLGIFVAWLADRYSRRTIIATALALWSAMTAACGFVSSFGGLLLARMGVGIGEAGGQAPAYSLISDYYPPHKRASAFAVLNCAVPVGVFLGLFVGGWISEYYGWRAAFMAVGVPGVLVALLVRLTVREPPRGFSEVRRTAPPIAPPMRAALKHLWSVRSYRHLVLASSIFTMGAMGSGIWIPSFFIRVHQMSGTEVATWLACIYGAGGVVGALMGGRLADRLVAKTGDQRWYAWLSMGATVCILPFAFFVYLWPNPIQALLVHIGAVVLMHMWMGPVYATIQGLAGVSRRAVAAAVNLLLINLIAYGMGPLLVGIASDYFSERYGNDSLRYSILTIVIVAYGWAAVHFYLAAKSLRLELQAAEQGAPA